MGVDLCVDVLVPSPLNPDLHTKGPVWSDGFPESPSPSGTTGRPHVLLALPWPLGMVLMSGTLTTESPPLPHSNFYLSTKHYQFCCHEVKKNHVLVLLCKFKSQEFI